MGRTHEMTELGIGPTLNLSGTMYVDLERADDVALFDEITLQSGQALGLSTVEDMGYIYESPTVVTSSTILIGAAAIRSHFMK